MMSEVQIMPPPRAAQYIRMSTEHQRYSLENQIAGIAAYAAERGYNIVRTYQDAGKSGLTLRGREGLKKLLADVVTGQPDFSAVLVLDISRWGRFQDTDQAAHYEFICRDAGIAVVYCGEPFDNDGSMVASILKNIKRVMAGEYSRELSAKVIKAQLQQAQLGFNQGGSMQYGIRRLLVDKDRTPRFILGKGEWKGGLQTDRIVLVQGPIEELTVVRRIFRMFVSERRSMNGIAACLNEEKISYTNGESWHARRIKSVLISELMIGNYIYNRTTQRLSNGRKINPPDQWIRLQIMEPIVDVGLFAKAQREMHHRRGYPYVVAPMLKNLKRLLREKKKLTIDMIDACPYTPSGKFYAAHYGNIKAVYAAAGYNKPERLRRRRRKYSDEDLLEGIRRLHSAFGYVTSATINADPDLPVASAFKKRFGSMEEAYTLAGFPVTRKEVLSAARNRAYARFLNMQRVRCERPEA